MKRQAPVERLTESEAKRARALAQRLGAAKAAKLIGVDVRTLTKACAGFPVQRLTAHVLRAKLPDTI